MMKKGKENVSSGHMTNNFSDVVELGKQMERLRDEQELKRDGYTQDPVQYDDEDEKKEEAK